MIKFFDIHIQMLNHNAKSNMPFTISNFFLNYEYLND